MSARLLAIVDVLDGDHVRQSHPILAAEGEASSTPPALRIGRHLGCDLVLDDPHLAAEHAVLQLTADAAQLTLLPSLNGALQGRRRHGAGEQLLWPADGVVQLGHTRLRLRHAGAALAPEKPMLHAPRWLAMALLALALLLNAAWDTWKGQEPGSPWMTYVGPLLALGAVLVVWASVWALLTQLFQRRFPFFVHLRRVLVFLAAVEFGTDGLTALAFMASAPWLLVLNQLLPIFGGIALVYWHARDVWPRARRGLLVLLGLGTALWLANGWTRQAEVQHRWRDPYVWSLLPPAWRLAPLHSVDELLNDAAALREPLATKAKRDAEDGDSPEGD